MKSLLRKLSWLIHRRDRERELEAELQFHLDEEAAERQNIGLSEAEAHAAARRDLGNLALVQENTRAVWGWILIEQFSQDLRYAWRTMVANPLFTVLAVVSVALGVGASTSVYSFVDAVLLRSLPVEDPESLVVLNWKMKIPEKGVANDTVMNGMDGNTYEDPQIGWTGGIFPYPAFEVLRRVDSAFSSIFAFHPAGNLNVSIAARAELAEGVYVSGDYFRGLGAVSAAGRLFARDADEPSVSPVAVLSFGFSERRFGSPEKAVGQPILINNVPFTITGVAPADFSGVDPARVPDLYLPLHSEVLLAANNRDVAPQMYLDENYYWLQMMARLRPGVGLVQAQAAAAIPFRQWVETTAHTELQRSDVPQLLLSDGSGGTDALRRQYARPLYVLLLLVILILAIACANIANLLLARAATRRREIALRLTVGAGRMRILRQLLTESVLLATLGGVLGIFFASWGIRFLTILLQNGRTAAPRAELNWHVLAAATALSILTGLFFGLAPAILSSRANVMPALKEVRSANAPTWIRLGGRDVLVVSQIAISLFMLVAAGLFVRTLSNLQSIDIGFNRDNLLLFQINARQSGHTGIELAGFYEDLRRRLTELPGVRSASLSNRPFFTAGFGLPVTVSGKRVDTMVLFVGPGFFSTLQIPIIQGREIDSSDHSGSPMTAVVSELFARQFLTSGSPIGRQIELTDARQLRQMQVVGIAKDARYGGLKRNLRPVIYVPYDQGALAFIDQMTYGVRTAGDPLASVSAIREVVHQMDPGLPVANITTQAGQIDRTISQEIMFGRLSSVIALIGLSIACVGLYGAVAYSVARRTSEIGIRMALGARRARVTLMVLQKVMVCTLAALALGLPLCLVASREMESFLFGITPRDPLTIAIALSILLVSAALAAFIPARRAARIDPVIALRHE